MTIEFNDNLLTGNATIDAQHKELFDRIERFMNTVENGGGKVDAVNMLGYLMEYTNFHFSAEENLQKAASYPELDKHLVKHTEFKKVLIDLEDYLEESEGPTDEFVALVEKNVVNWFIGHIQSFDRSVAEYLNLHSNPALV